MTATEPVWFVDAEPTRARLRDLRSLGLTWAQIAAACGVDERTLHKSVEMRRGTVCGWTADAVARIPTPKVAHRSDVWRAKAACLGADTELFFPKRGEPADEARAICRRCPVRVDCLDAHLDEREGIWGGTSGRERKRLRAERRSTTT